MNETLPLTPKLQEPADLVLVVSRRIIPGPVTVLRRSTVLWHDLEITFGVLCESHEVVLRRNGEVVLHERLSCVKSASNGSITHEHVFDNGLCHSFEQDGYFVRVHGKAVSHSGISLPAAKLSVAFPNAVDGDVVPITSIHWEDRDDEFTWSTVHLYALQNRAIGVFSESRVDRHVGNGTAPRSVVSGARTREAATT